MGDRFYQLLYHHHNTLYAASSTSPLPVTVRLLSELLIQADFSVPATLVSLNHSTFGTEIGGKVSALHVEIGDYVRKGQLVAELDCRDNELAYEQALRALESAEAGLQFNEQKLYRSQRLRRDGVIAHEALDESIMERDTSLADVNLQKVLISQRRLSMERCNIFSPLTGQITEKFLGIGQYVLTGSMIYKVLQTDEIELQAELSYQELAALRQASRIQFKLDGHSRPVKIRSVLGEVDTQTNKQKVRFILEQATNFKAGAVGRLHWLQEKPLIPTDFIIQRENSEGDSRYGIMLAEKNVARFFELDNVQEGHPVISPLPLDTEVIDLNRLNVRNGQLIKKVH